MRWSLPWFLLCGAFAGWLLGGVAPEPLVKDLRQDMLSQPWRLQRPPEDPVEVTEDRWFFLPHRFGDFDLQMDVELGEGADLDVLLRQVEPRYVDETKLPFAARWSTLRLSTEGDGVGWRTRDEALFGPPGDGVGVAPGYVSTVWIGARGRTLTANVAGKKQPPFEAADHYGMLTLIVRGGNAVVRRLEILPKPFPFWCWSRWTWAAFGLLGALVVGGGAALAKRFRGAWAGGLVLVLAIAADVLTLQLPVLALPDPGVLAFALASALLLAGLFVVRAGNVAVLALGVGSLLLWLPVVRYAPDDTAAVEHVFGLDAGDQVTEAYGQLVRGPFGLHDVTFDGPRAFLLGGEVLYGVSDPQADLEVLVTSELKRRLGRDVDVPCPRTELGDVGQQWRLFERFYQGYRPDVLVLGVDVVAEHDSLREVVEQARSYGERTGARVVLFATTTLADEHVEVLRQLGAEGVPVVLADPEEPRSAVAARLADAIEPGMER